MLLFHVHFSNQIAHTIFVNFVCLFVCFFFKVKFSNHNYNVEPHSEIPVQSHAKVFVEVSKSHIIQSNEDKHQMWH